MTEAAVSTDADTAYGRVALDFVPRSPAELIRACADPRWRLASGRLYTILAKANQADETGWDEPKKIPFQPNAAQLKLMDGLWHRNIVLKARQLGFTTLVSLMWLDHALFVADQRCAMIAEDRAKAEAIFRDKVRFAYENLPESLRQAMPLARKSAAELLFGHNNSSIRVAVSARSGTYDRLHVSEFGKICASDPLKAEEIVTGSLPAVPLTGVAVIESTAKGQEGPFYAMTMRALALQEAGAALSPRDWRLHFFPWHQDPGYRLDEASSSALAPTDLTYFDELKQEYGVCLTPEQRAWYVKTRDGDFSGEEETMWQEYPSHVGEPFKVSLSGSYFARQLAKARKEGRLADVPFTENVPINTFWDIGSGDGTAIWLHQHVDGQDRFSAFIEGWEEPYLSYIRQLERLAAQHRLRWGTHFLPHDADHRRQQGQVVATPLSMLQEIVPAWRFEVVPRVAELATGIELARKAFAHCWFDEAACAAGLRHLALYRKAWNRAAGRFADRPLKDEHTEAADAFRQFAQSVEKVRGRAPGETAGPTRARTKPLSGMAL